eukprot:jgi/Chlat1/2539/Chrsp175S02392
MAAAGGTLSEVHELQVQAYLRFAAMKRQQHLREVCMAFDDAAALRGLSSSSSSEDDAAVTASNGVVWSRTDVEALAAGVDAELYTDTSSLENMSLLSEIAKLDREGQAKPASAFAIKPQRLARVAEGQRTGVDAKAMMDRDAAKEELTGLRERFASLQTQCTSILKEKSKLAEECAALSSKIDGLTAELESGKQASESRDSEARATREELAQLQKQQQEAQMQASVMSEKAASELHNQLVTARKEVFSLQEELRTAKLELKQTERALDTKLSDSKPFLTLKKMMQSKTEQIKSLQQRLAKYEKVTLGATSEDDDDEVLD